MANKVPNKQSNIKDVWDRVKPIAIAIGLIGFGASVTALILFQTTPLREDLKDAKKQCSELLKKNDDCLSKVKSTQLLNENLIKENDGLRNEIKQKNIENEKLKTQFSQINDENKALSIKLSNVQQEYKKLSNEIKKYESEIIAWQKSYNEYAKKLKGESKDIISVKAQDKKASEKKSVSLNGTTIFYDNDIFISLNYVDYGKGKVSGVITSSGYPEQIIDNWVVGKAYFYKTNKSYEIRIMGMWGNGAEFLVIVK